MAGSDAYSSFKPGGSLKFKGGEGVSSSKKKHKSSSSGGGSGSSSAKKSKSSSHPASHASTSRLAADGAEREAYARQLAEKEDEERRAEHDALDDEAAKRPSGSSGRRQTDAERRFAEVQRKRVSWKSPRFALLCCGSDHRIQLSDPRLRERKRSAEKPPRATRSALASSTDTLRISRSTTTCPRSDRDELNRKGSSKANRKIVWIYLPLYNNGQCRYENDTRNDTQASPNGCGPVVLPSLRPSPVDPSSCLWRFHLPCSISLVSPPLRRALPL